MPCASCLLSVVLLTPPSIVCSNRDEHLARPTQPASFDGPILAGIDTQAGGTWLGIHRTGRLALLTNITEPAHTMATSRGHLVAAFLSAHTPTDAPYAGFNLIQCSPTAPPPALAYDAHLVTNHGAGGSITQRALAADRAHGVSNGIDGAGADAWPKVQHGLAAFERVLATCARDDLAERLLDLLTWRSSPPPRAREDLKDTIQVEPMWIEDAWYATRLSTVVLVTRTGEVVFIERDRWMLSPDGEPVLADPRSQRVFRFSLE